MIYRLTPPRLTENMKCVICGCNDHKIFGCVKHYSKKCSCFDKQ